MHKGEEERRSAGDKQLCGRERRRSSRADCKQISGARGRQAMAPASFNAGNRLHPLNVPVETEQRTPCVRLNTERDRDRERGRERESVCVCCVLATHTHTHTHTKHTHNTHTHTQTHTHRHTHRHTHTHTHTHKTHGEGNAPGWQRAWRPAAAAGSQRLPGPRSCPQPAHRSNLECQHTACHLMRAGLPPRTSEQANKQREHAGRQNTHTHTHTKKMPSQGFLPALPWLSSHINTRTSTQNTHTNTNKQHAKTLSLSLSLHASLPFSPLLFLP